MWFNKALLIILAGLFLVTPVLFLSGFLCDSGFISAEIFYLIILGCITISSSSHWRVKRVSKLSLELLIPISLVYISIIPVMMIFTATNEGGGFDYFLNERMPQYIYLEIVALLILAFSAINYSSVKSLYIPNLKRNIITPLKLALYLRLFWLIFSETKHLSKFAQDQSQYMIEYVVLISIPLFLAILILTFHHNLIGYILGFFLGVIHAILTIGLLIIGVNPGSGPFIVIPVSLLVSAFCIRGVMKYHFDNNLELPSYAYFVMRQVLKMKKRIRAKDIEKVLEIVEIKENMKIMDYGTGIGNYAIKAAKIMNNSGSIIAVDINQNMLCKLEEKAKVSGLNNVKPLLIHSLDDIKDTDFDYIFLIDVLHLLKDKKTSTINFFMRLLSKNGKLLLTLDHLDKDQIELLFENCEYSKKNLVFKNYWILSP